MLIWQVPQYNLTKLFQMKLKKLSATRSILWKKTSEIFGQPNTSCKWSHAVQHLFHLTLCLQGSSMSLHISECLLVLSLNNISLYVYITFCLFIHLWWHWSCFNVSLWICCCKCGCTNISSRLCFQFFQIYFQKRDSWIIW